MLPNRSGIWLHAATHILKSQRQRFGGEGKEFFYPKSAEPGGMAGFFLKVHALWKTQALYVRLVEGCTQSSFLHWKKYSPLGNAGDCCIITQGAWLIPGCILALASASRKAVAHTSGQAVGSRESEGSPFPQFT